MGLLNLHLKFLDGTLNRTIVELKCQVVFKRYITEFSLNRTIVELKYVQIRMQPNLIMSLNRTIVELKWFSTY